MIKASLPFLGGKKDEFFLGIGEVAFAKRPCVIRTVLGSCVGVALYDPRLRIGGMCHFLLAEAPPGQASTRFGDVAINSLLRSFLQAGSNLGALEANVAGGGLILDMNEVFFVGERNIKVADRVLAERGIRVARREVGGEKGRRMILDSETGAVSIEVIPEFDPDRKLAL